MTKFLDALLEFRISLAARRDMSKPENWERFTTLIRRRSTAQIARMERSRGLAE